MTTVVLDAFAPSELYRYAFLEFDRLKKYHWKCMRKDFSHQFANRPKRSSVNVISVPASHDSTEAKGRERHRVVAIAAWKIMEPHAALDEYMDLEWLSVYRSMAKCSEHLGINMTRALDFDRQFSMVEKHLVTDYPHPQMHLALLATHPDWDGNGFGAMHCHWGMEKTKAMNMPNTLIGSPAGWPLYNSLGFSSMANITIKTLDWPEDLWYEYMRFGE